MYKFIYNWDDDELLGFKEYFNKLYTDSIIYFLGKDHQKSLESQYLSLLRIIFNYIEKYFNELLKQNPSLDKIDLLRGLINIKLVRFLPVEYRKSINGLTVDGIIYFNPTFVPFEGLNYADTLKLCVFHELGHIFINTNDFFMESLEKNIYDEKLLNTYHHDLNIPFNYETFTKGFDMLEEVVTQDMSENLLAKSKKTRRINPKTYNNKYIYPNGSFTSNFHKYQEFQEMAYKFISCLAFMRPKKDESMDSLIKRFCTEYMSKDFAFKMLSEYNMASDERKADLLLMIHSLGEMKKAVYTCFGIPEDSVKKINKSKTIGIFNEIAEKNKIQIEREKTKRKV